MITEIYIENRRLDLSQDLSNEFTYAIDDIKDFASRNTNFSKTIILPGNAVNNKLFGHIFEFNSANLYNPSQDNVGYNFNASKAASCIIYVDKIQVFKGILRLLEVTVDRGSIEYECVVFGELGGFITALNNYKLEELDFSQYDHDWTFDNITASWEQASGTTASGMGYYYPLIDYGQVGQNNKKDWSYKAFRPALFVREYLDKIITNSGYTYESDFFNSNLFKRLVIPNNQKSLSNYASTQIDANAATQDVSSSGASVTTDVEYPNPSIFIGYEFGVGGFRDFYWTGANFTPTLTLRFVGELNYEQGGSAALRMHILKNGSIVNTQIVASSSDIASQVVFDNTLTYDISLNTNDYFSVQLELYNITGGGASYLITTESNLTSTTSVAIASPLTYGALININSGIPRGVFQRDFISSIVKMFNLYIVEDTTKDKHLKIVPFIDYYSTTANFLQVNDLEEELLVDDTNWLLLDDYSASHLDWSYKIDRDKPFKIKPMSELNGRFFEFKYKQDSDKYNEEYFKHYSEGYADHTEDTGFEFANDKQTTEIMFSATPLLGYAGEDKVFPTIFKLSNTSSNSPSEDTFDHNIRIMQVRKITGVSNWNIKGDSGNVGTTLNSYGYGGHLDDPDAPTADINFGVPKEIYFSLAITYPSANLYNAFWSDYIAEITDKDSKLLTCSVYLKNSDIFSLDFSKLIYIDGALWRLNKVIDYNPTSPDSTKCEFLKVIELTYA